MKKTESKGIVQGRVVKRSGNKTVSVEVVTLIQHPLYRKKMKRTKRYLAHDPNNDTQVGTMVTLIPTRPLSARKRWRVSK